MRKVIIGLVVIWLLVGLWFGFYAYSWGYEDVTISNESTGPYVIAYQVHTGSYNKVFWTIQKISKSLKSEWIPTSKAMWIYFSDPKVVAEKDLLSHVGILVPTDYIWQLDHSNENYSIQSLPELNRLVGRFPYTNPMSILVGLKKAYPKMDAYLEQEAYRLDVERMEIYDYDMNEIRFIIPLATWYNMNYIIGE